MDLEKVMHTYVIMPHYIVNDELERLATNSILSIKKTEPSVIVISVDDASPKETWFLDKISDYVIRRKTNDGFAMACNDGFRLAMSLEEKDCYIVCANNDIEVFNGWHDALVDQMESWDNVAFAGLVSSSELEYKKQPIKDFSINTVSEGGILMKWMQSGALWMSKKSVLQKIGLFDEAMKRGGMEDWDIFLRARDTFGMRILMSARSMFWHEEGATRWKISKKFKKENEKIQSKNEKLFLERWGEFYNPRNGYAWREKILRDRGVLLEN